MRRSRLTLLTLLALLVGLSGSLSAQDRADDKKGGTLAITNARVDGHDGLVTVIVSGGKIRGVGSDVRVQRGLQRVDAAGARVVPGRIDAWAAVSGADALGRGVDAFDRHDSHAIDEALRNGVTAVFLSPTGGTGVAGQGSVVKLRPGVPLKDLVVLEQGAVVASLGGLDLPPIARVAAWGALRGALEGARRHHDALAEYDEALKKWLEAVGGAAAVDSRTGTAAVTSPAPADAAPVTSPTSPAGRPEGRRGRRPPGAEDAARDLEPPDTPPRPRRGRGGPPAGGPPPGGEGGEGQKEEEKKTERPKRPAPDRAARLLGRVLERELPLRLQAHRAEDIVAALELQREFGIRIIIVGAREAHRVADLLAGREDVQVVLGDPTPPNDARLRPALVAPGVASALRARGVPFAIGTGDFGASRFVELVASLAASQGLAREAAEEAITIGAAEVLGVSDRLGRVAIGYDADLVVLDPSPSGPRPRMVVVDGHIVWRREQ